MSDQPLIKLEGVTKRYPAKTGVTTVFENVWLSIGQGEFVCVIGHSGCGKTTILNILAGLEPPSEGYVFVQGREISGPSLERAVIFQSHALLPWLTVLGNIAFAVKSRWPDWDRARVRTHCQRYIDLVNLSGSEKKRPDSWGRKGAGRFPGRSSWSARRGSRSGGCGWRNNGGGDAGYAASDPGAAC